MCAAISVGGLVFFWKFLPQLTKLHYFLIGKANITNFVEIQRTMQKLFFLLFLAALSSCEICRDCTCTTTSSLPGFQKTSTTTEVCGSRSDIQKVDGKTETRTQVNGVTYYTVQDCDCR